MVHDNTHVCLPVACGLAGALQADLSDWDNFYKIHVLISSINIWSVQQLLDYLIDD